MQGWAELPRSRPRGGPGDPAVTRAQELGRERPRVFLVPGGVLMLTFAVRAERGGELTVIYFK